MNFKRTLACIGISALMCTSFASCKSKDSTSKSVDIVDNTNGVSDEVSVAAKSGEAYISIMDGEHFIQYLGRNDDAAHKMLSYNAGVANISGNGTYTVSLTTNTKGFRRDTTGNENDGSVVPKGVSAMSVMIKDGETIYPNAVITINSVTVNGKSIAMIAKSYTSSDDGKDTKANIYNEYVGKKLPKDARCSQGKIYDGNGNAAAFAGEYAPIVVNAEDFASWTDVTVNFTVSGIN